MKMRKKRLPFSSQMVNLGENNKTFMKSRVTIILICSLFLLVNCGGTKGEGSVGDVTLVRGELPEETESIDLFWSITGQPDASKLSMNDLEFNQDKSEMSFTPDAPGKYQFELEIFQYGDELETQKFTYTVDSIEPLVADASEEESVTEDNEEWLEEEYEEELDDEYSEYDYDEVESEEDTMEYYVSDDNTENNEMTEEEGTEEKENELFFKYVPKKNQKKSIKTITKENLPQHEHNLQANNGDQFFASRMIAGASRFLGLPGLALGLGMSGYDAYKNYQNQEGMIYNLFNKDE